MSAAAQLMSIDAAIESTHKRLARQFENAVEQFDPLDKQSFAQFFVSAEKLGVGRSALMDEFNVSGSTISRWIDRKSFPATYARANIIRRLGALVAAQTAEGSGVASSHEYA
jgi:hypothetical protein